MDAKPNTAHRALAQLEAAGKLIAVITQNIDGLHQAAGSRTVYELHGSIHRNYCTVCGKSFDAAFVKMQPGVPTCPDCGGRIKPDVVLYEEMLDEEVISGAVKALQSADLLIIGGSSLVVYPAAGLIRYFQGDQIVLINKGATEMDRRAELLIKAPIGEVFSQIHI